MNRFPERRLPPGYFHDDLGFVYTGDGLYAGHISRYDHQGRWLGDYGPGEEVSGAAGEDLGPCDPIDEFEDAYDALVEQVRAEARGEPYAEFIDSLMDDLRSGDMSIL